MGGRKQRETLTALELITEKVRTVWGCGDKWVASMLSLDMTGAFDHASHLRLIHILRNKKIPSWIVNWVVSFLKDRQATIKIYSSNQILEILKQEYLRDHPYHRYCSCFTTKSL